MSSPPPPRSRPQNYRRGELGGKECPPQLFLPGKPTLLLGTGGEGFCKASQLRCQFLEKRKKKERKKNAPKPVNETMERWKSVSSGFLSILFSSFFVHNTQKQLHRAVICCGSHRTHRVVTQGHHMTAEVLQTLRKPKTPQRRFAGFENLLEAVRQRLKPGHLRFQRH